MHEHHVVRDVLHAALDAARDAGAGRVAALRVRIGPGSHVTPEAFRGHFELLARDTPLADAHLDVERGAELEGEEVLLESLEVEAEAPGQSGAPPSTPSEEPRDAPPAARRDTAFPGPRPSDGGPS